MTQYENKAAQAIESAGKLAMLMQEILTLVAHGDDVTIGIDIYKRPYVKVSGTGTWVSKDGTILDALERMRTGAPFN